MRPEYGGFKGSRLSGVVINRDAEHAKEVIEINIYKAIWKVIGGRPWTYILRDIWHKYEGLCIIALMAAGALLGHWLWPQLLWLFIPFTLGYIAGHLFWGKEYIPDQQGEG